MEETVEASVTHNEVGRLGKSDTQKTEVKRDREKQRLTYLIGLIKWITGFGINNKKSKVIKNYKSQGGVEVHDRLSPEGTRHIKNEDCISEIRYIS